MWIIDALIKIYNSQFYPIQSDSRSVDFQAGRVYETMDAQSKENIEPGDIDRDADEVATNGDYDRDGVWDRKCTRCQKPTKTIQEDMDQIVRTHL